MMISREKYKPFDRPDNNKNIRRRNTYSPTRNTYEYYDDHKPSKIDDDDEKYKEVFRALEESNDFLSDEDSTTKCGKAFEDVSVLDVSSHGFLNDEPKRRNASDALLRKTTQRCLQFPASESMILASRYGPSDVMSFRQSIKVIGKNPFKTLRFNIERLNLAFRVSLPPKLAHCRNEFERKCAAVHIIYGCWERYVYRSVFVYLKKLIYIYRKTNPALLLRTMNPSEANLMLEPMTISHLRFRLGGTHFPPSVMYKIFNVRPLVASVNKRRDGMKKMYTPPLVEDRHDINSWRPWIDWYTKIPNTRSVKDAKSCSIFRSNTNSYHCECISRQSSFMENENDHKTVLFDETRILSSSSESMSLKEKELLDWVNNLPFEDY